MKIESIPSPEARHAAYAEALAGLGRAQAKLTMLDAEVNAHHMRAAAARRDNARSRLDAAAESLLAGGEIDAPPVLEDADLVRIDRERRVARRAVEMALERVNALKWPASQAVCAELEPDARKLVADFARALTGLGRVLESAAALQNAMEVRGVLWSAYLHLPSIPQLGAVEDPYGAVAGFFYEAVDRGALALSDVPKDWRATWEPKRAFTTPAQAERDRLATVERNQKQTEREGKLREIAEKVHHSGLPAPAAARLGQKLRKAAGL